MLIDGVVKQFPTATVEIDTPFYKGHAKALCMDHPVQELIIGNSPGALGLSQHRGERTEVKCPLSAIDKLINGSQNNVTTVVDTKEVCDQCDTLKKSLSRSLSDTAIEIKRNDVVERPQIQNDEHEEVIPSDVEGGAPHEEHDGHTAHEDQENPKVSQLILTNVRLYRPGL